MAGEIERWITVNGAHIPIMKGESKMSAVGRFIKERRNAVKNKLKQETGIYTNKFRNAKSSKERTAAAKELGKLSAREQLYGNDVKIKGNGASIAGRMKQRKEAAAYKAGKEWREGWDKQAQRYEKEAKELWEPAQKEWEALQEKGDRLGAKLRQKKYEYDYEYARAEANKARKYGDYEEMRGYYNRMTRPYKMKLSSNYKTISNDVKSGKLQTKIDTKIQNYGANVDRSRIAKDVYRQIRADFPNSDVYISGESRVNVDGKEFRFSYNKSNGWRMVEDYKK